MERSLGRAIQISSNLDHPVIDLAIPNATIRANQFFIQTRSALANPSMELTRIADNERVSCDVS